MKQVRVALFCLLAPLVIAADTPAKFGTLTVGSRVAALKVVDADGNEMSLPGAPGNVTVISIMGTNRTPGTALENVYLKFREQGVNVVGISAGSTRADFDVWRAKLKGAVSYPLVWDPAGSNRAASLAQTIFGVGTYPMTVVMDRQGNLAGGFVGFGAATMTVLEEYLRTSGVAIPQVEASKRPPVVPSSNGQMLKPGEVAPDFTTPNLRGEAVKLSDFAGKIVVLDFWATWCGPCIASMPHTQKIAAATKAQGVVVLASCTSDTRAKFEAWLGEHGAKYPDLVFTNDPNGRDADPEKFRDRASARLYGVTGIPCQFVIGRDGKVSEVIRGFGPGDTRLNEALKKLGVKVEH